MAKPRFTHQQHTELGRELYELRKRIQQLGITVSNAYPLSGREAKAGKQLLAAVDRIDAARSELEEAMFREHPDVAEVSTYYPGATDRA